MAPTPAVMLWDPAQEFLWNDRVTFKLFPGVKCILKEDQNVVPTPRTTPRRLSGSIIISYQLGISIMY